MAKLILLRHKVCHSNYALPSAANNFFRFKLQIESGVVPPRHRELTPSPHVRTQKPLGCALGNPLEESNIINSFLAFALSFLRNSFSTLLYPNTFKMNCTTKNLSSLVFHVLAISFLSKVHHSSYPNNSNVLGISVEPISKCYSITHNKYYIVKKNNLCEMVPFIGDHRKHAFP